MLYTATVGGGSNGDNIQLIFVRYNDFTTSALGQIRKSMHMLFCLNGSTADKVLWWLASPRQVVPIRSTRLVRQARLMTNVQYCTHDQIGAFSDDAKSQGWNNGDGMGWDWKLPG